MNGKRVFLTALALCMLSGLSAAQKDDDFASQLDYLRRQSMREVGKEAVVDAFTNFINEYQDDPRVAEAMIDLGHLMENEIPDLGIRRDPAAALKWFRMAAARAAPGSETWTKAQFLVVARVQFSSPVEARAILKEIAGNAQGDSLTLARVELGLQGISIGEGDLDAAESHCRRVLSWYDDRARIPTDPLQKRELDLIIAYAGSGMLEAFLGLPVPKADRAKRIRALMADHAGLGSLGRDGTEALQKLEKMPDAPAMIPLAAETGWTVWLRWTLTLVSVVVFLILGWLFLIRRRRRA